METELSLKEKLITLSINPIKGGNVYANSMGYALNGAMLIELLHDEKVLLKDNRIVHNNFHYEKDLALKMVLEKIKLSSKPRKIKYWIQSLNYQSGKNIRLTLEELCRKQVLRMEERRFLFIPYKTYFVRDIQLIFQLAEAINQAIYSTEKNDMDVVLAKLLYKSGMLKRVYPEYKKRSEAGKLIKCMPDDLVSKAVGDAIAQMNAAVVISAAT